MGLVVKKGASSKEIAAIRKKINGIPEKGVDTKKYCGVIKLKEEPMLIQKKMRDEWERNIYFDTLKNV
jgi:hypothetical protein